MYAILSIFALIYSANKCMHIYVYVYVCVYVSICLKFTYIYLRKSERAVWVAMIASKYKIVELREAQ